MSASVRACPAGSLGDHVRLSAMIERSGTRERLFCAASAIMLCELRTVQIGGYRVASFAVQ
jgi:hypothetical protein